MLIQSNILHTSKKQFNLNDQQHEESSQKRKKKQTKKNQQQMLHNSISNGLVQLLKTDADQRHSMFIIVIQKRRD